MRAIRMLCCICVLTSSVSASTITIGEIGIKSFGLPDAQGSLLNGAGVAIGQLEPHRPGDEDAGDFPNFRNSDIDPEAVFYRNVAPTPNDPVQVQNHAS